MDSAPVAVSVFSSRNAAFSWSRGGHRIAVRGEAVRSGAGACAPSLGPYGRGLALCRVRPAGVGRGTGNRGTPITGRFAAFESSAVGLVYRGRLAGLGGWGGPPCRAPHSRWSDEDHLISERMFREYRFVWAYVLHACMLYTASVNPQGGHRFRKSSFRLIVEHVTRW